MSKRTKDASTNASTGIGVSTGRPSKASRMAQAQQAEVHPITAAREAKTEREQAKRAEAQAKRITREREREDKREAKAIARAERAADREARKANQIKSNGRLTEAGLIARYPHVVVGTLQYEESGKWAGKQTVTINTIGLDGMPDGNQRRVATSDLFQIRHTPEVAILARKARKAERKAAQADAG